jgi:predicted aminopeptidase
MWTQGLRFSTSKAVLLLPLTLLSGCTTSRYLFQAAGGQLELFNRARPLTDVVQDVKVPTITRELLGQVPAIKGFGETQGLRATANYTHYVDLKRPAVVWVVSACRPLKFEPKEWSFPIVGSFPYLGWFSREAALEDARTIEREGWDVDVRGAGAYSTLGWFKDPILSTMIESGPQALAALVNVVLHESVHATVYINGQSFFNESLASFVADRMSESYFEKQGDNAKQSLMAYRSLLSDSAKRAERLHRLYLDLSKLYSSSVADEVKLKKKEDLLTAAANELKFSRKINNATLIQFKTYHAEEAEFESLWKACQGNWRNFLSVVGQLKAVDFPAPQSEEFSPVLTRLVSLGCQSGERSAAHSK